ncbi:hypothetical protein COW36_12590 [bacterium (Candidatus Blackallbacteria) CG17_big_fil_post_rev_8_21_14_2_50_48_46]|uniref:Uncharacterized protein n=1 Tax=bacterium (Candidatus Blackallbacteria) CG17_big_fil_post_rev_8_21_14_2_50_48_46 TaxID=2014261 RepID=A0A2M7G411_9BACT|nr:MAG: hypothetical protein COW64_02670 [bacterium (Candidatus Blackallbacteria) CG18_big_fil_WC_8_21_14_2_50_49_26]PIW16599.1 MAG: hypothetical protein COW36_12590 [bacterium (Candidatus Blackallbacteria) CG17_big_fil_post_rev_8_21_14_2_50_48_46]PIW46107.1 MAG: hypothetical protein COW20_17855 [bacterium (Candidatus Blackallbacteria) CG13_big_fil_rev_8_21_14_2_50_49_14]
MDIRSKSLISTPPVPPPTATPTTTTTASTAPTTTTKAPTWKQSETGEWVKTGATGQAIAAQKKLEDTPSVIEKVRAAAESIDPSTLDENATQTKGLMKAIRENTLPVFDHKLVGKTKMDSSVTTAIALAKAKNSLTPVKMESDLPSLKKELYSKEMQQFSLETTVVPTTPKEKEDVAIVKHVINRDIQTLKARISSREIPMAPVQKGHELLRKRTVDPLATEKSLAALPGLRQELTHLEGRLDERDKLITQVKQLQQNLSKAKEVLGSEAGTEIQDQINTLKKSIASIDPEKIGTRIEEIEAHIHSAEHQTTWERVKTTHINQTTSATKLSMVMALDARLSEFKEASRQIGKEMGIQVVFPGDPLPQEKDASYLKVTICGSTELSSDIDVNTTPINLPIGTETKFIMKFNALSQATHGDQTGNKYDINVYNSMNNKFPNVDAELAQGDGITPERTRVLPPDAQKLDDKNESIISYLHMHRFMSGSQFEQFKSVHAETLKTIVPDKAEALTGRLGAGQKISESSALAVKEKMQELRESGKYVGKNDKELELIASNILYEKASEVAHELTDKASTPLDTVAADHEMTKAHYFANEAAMTSGVLRATVAKEQIVPGINEKRAEKDLEPVEMIDVSSEEYASAGRENIGNVFKEINHHKEDPAPMQLVRAAKYFGRANRNYEDLISKTGITLSPAATEARAFLQKLSDAEGYSGENKKLGLLALRKDQIGGENPMKINGGESVDQAKLRHATAIMQRHGLGEYVENPSALHAKMIESYAILDAELSAHILEQ